MTVQQTMNTVMRGNVLACNVSEYATKALSKCKVTKKKRKFRYTMHIFCRVSILQP